MKYNSCKKYNLSRSTLYDYVRSNWEPFQAIQSKYGRKPIMPLVLEEKVVEYLLLNERKYIGCTRDDVRRLAFQLTVQNKIASPFSIAKEAARKHWVKRCTKWHSDKLSLRQPTEHPLPEPQDSTRNKWGFSLIFMKNSFLLMITHPQLFST